MLLRMSSQQHPASVTMGGGGSGEPAGSPARFGWWLAFGLSVLVGVGLASLRLSGVAGASDERGGVVVSLAPLGGLVRPVLGPGVEVTSVVPTGVSPHGWELDPRSAATVRSARVVIVSGMPIDASIERLARSRGESARVVRLVDLLGGTGDEPAAAVGHHLWLDMGAVMRLASALPGALAAAGLEVDASAAEAWAASVSAIDRAYAERLAPYVGRTVAVQHDAWGELLGRYGIRSIVMTTRAHASPDPGEVALALRAASGGMVAGVFGEPQLPPGLPRLVAERAGLPLGELDPLGSGDWAAMMRSNLDRLCETLGSSGSR